MEKQQPATKYNGFLTKRGNLIWAGALSLAWHQLVDNIIKEPVKIQSNDPNTLKTLHNFNTCPFTKKDISDKCIYVKSGYGQQTVTKINAECKKKFPEKSFGDIKTELKPSDIISYAYLLKKLEFTIKFNKNQNESFLFEGKKVPSFHAKDKKQKKQVKWFSYKSQDEFLISVDAKNPSDQIFLIRKASITSIDEVIKSIQALQGKHGQQLDDNDVFEMPIVDLDVSRNVEELEGKTVANKMFDNYVFAVVFEALKLRIDEAGAKVQNEGVVIMLERCVMKKEQPKRFVLNKQFWVVMKEKGKHPYFCALIKNPSEK